MATILRQDRPAEAPAGEAIRPAVYTLSDMGRQGDEYTRAVRAEAAKIVQQANAEAAEIRRAAEAEGRRVAAASITEMLDRRIGERLETIAPALDGAVRQVLDSRGAWLDHWEKATVGLACAIAERVVRRELAADPTISEAWVRESLELAAGSSELTVALNPDDHQHLASHVGRIAESIGGLAEPRVIADPSVSPGGCRVDTAHGSIDQQVESQLERLREELA